MLYEETRAIQEAAILPQNEGRLITAPGARIRIKISSENSGGSFSLIDYQADPAYAGPPPHWHKQMTELFYVLEGELTLQVGNSTFTVNAGTSAFIPTGTVHKFSNPSAQPVRFLIICSPGGFEHYFEEMIDAIGKAGGMPDKETMTALYKKYDVQDPAELE